MAHKEKGGPAGGRQIPNNVREDDLEFTAQPQDWQALRLTRRFGFAYDTCIVIAALAWGISR
jgi:hypothetical protein